MSTPKNTVTHADPSGYTLHLAVEGVVDDDIPNFIANLLTVAAQASVPHLGEGFDDLVMDHYEHLFRDREMRSAAPSEFDLGFEAGKKAERDEVMAQETPETPVEGLTLEGLQAVPVGQRVIDRQGDAWERQPGGRWLWTDPDPSVTASATLPSQDLHRHWSPLRREGHPFAAGVDTPSEF